MSKVELRQDLFNMALEELEDKYGLSSPSESAIQGMLAILESFPMIQYGLQAGAD